MDRRGTRFFVEKLYGHSGEANSLQKDIKETLQIEGVTRVRWLNFYEISELSPQELSQVILGVCSESQTDTVYHRLPEGNYSLIAREPLPGQFNQRADSAMQIIRLMFPHWQGEVISGQVILLEGALSRKELATITSFLINPVESRAKDITTLSLGATYKKPKKIQQITPFIDLSEEELTHWYKAQNLAMEFEDLLFCQNFFRNTLSRDPWETEIRVIDTYWSDHCRHTTFETELNSVDFPKDPLGEAMRSSWEKYLATRSTLGREEKPITLMDLATLAARDMRSRGLLDDWDLSAEINACTIRADVQVGDKQVPYLILFKNETHNHPTEIEPFGGAATCIGGAIRDPLSGRAYVYQAMRITGSGDPREPYEATLPGKLPQRTITTTAAKGYSSYGNQIGLATSLVKEIYHSGYKAKRMEVGAVVGAVPAHQVKREKPLPGDLIILVGGKTGRDGCGGATGSSKAHTEESLSSCGAEVQKGNPPEERKIQRLFRNPRATKLIKRCNDFGAGGVCVAIGEIADSLEINLDKIPVKYIGLNGTELAISESQERMAVVIAPQDLELWQLLSKEENLLSSPVGEVTDSGRLLIHWQGNCIVDIPRSFLQTNGVSRKTVAKVPKQQVLLPLTSRGVTPPVCTELSCIKEIPGEATGLSSPLEVPGEPSYHQSTIEKLKQQIQNLENCSQRGLVEQFDSQVGGGTVLMPYGGATQLTEPEASVHLIPMEGAEESTTTTVMAPGFDPHLSTQSPYLGAQYAVVESIGRIVAAGGEWRRSRLSLQEYFPSPGDSPEGWGQPLSAVLGAFEAQQRLSIPAIGGKDSMSGSFQDLQVPPTLISFGLALSQVDRVKSPEFKGPHQHIYLLKHNPESTGMPNYHELMNMWDWVVDKNSLITSMVTIKGGGVPVALAQMSRGNMIGAKISPSIDISVVAPGSILLTTAEPLPEGALPRYIGETTQDQLLTIEGESVTIEELITLWKAPLNSVFPDYVHTERESGMIRKATQEKQPNRSKESSRQDTSHIATSKRGAPRVIIPVFPGTNCEYESAAAFERAGGNATIQVLNNLSSKEMEESIEKLSTTIAQSNILMIPGGFSAGDEPDGSGKFIANILRTPRIADAIYTLLERDGLILGVCNGFQALLKSGLLPYGTIGIPKKDTPTLTHNQIYRHISRILDVKVVTENSPWLYGLKHATHKTPVSHGEGRFYGSKEKIAELVERGQIALQYVDPLGAATMSPLYNPNGSMEAVEGIISTDGKILGKMGHIERFHQGSYKNIPGAAESPIIANGVRYFL